MAHAHSAHGHGGPEAQPEANEHEHPTVKTYLVIFAWLMFLLIITLGAAYFDLGVFNLPIALTIALIKVVLIVAYFMHVKFSTILVRIFATTVSLWLVILFVLTLSDYFSRGWLPHPGK